MESSRVFLLLIGIFCVSLVTQAQAECCTTRADVTFTMDNGSCDMVGARRSGVINPGACTIAVCGDGTPIKGRFCGRGKCNIFGCNCDGGCRNGGYEKSFKEKNRKHGIEIDSVYYFKY